MATGKDKPEQIQSHAELLSPLSCGIVMPISALEDCSTEHWVEVRAIITEAVASIDEPRFKTRLVSDADEVGVIQKRIVQNLHDCDLVICDVSGKNPNVMFELGMRLAFDKPTVIIKDDKTGYSFDTHIIEHLPYPRDLRFSKIIEFKLRLAEKVLATYKAAKDESHSSFLKNFGQFKVVSLNEMEITPDKAVLELLHDIQREIETLRSRSYTPLKQESLIVGNPDARQFVIQAAANWIKNGKNWPKEDDSEFLLFINTYLEKRGFFLSYSTLNEMLPGALKQLHYFPNAR